MINMNKTGATQFYFFYTEFLFLKTVYYTNLICF